MDLETLNSKLEFRNPTDQELAKINQYRAIGSPEFSAEELYTVPIMASNNLIRFDMGAWSIGVLQTMAASYPGKPIILDHEMETENIVGFVYDAELWRMLNPPQKFLDQILAESPDKDSDLNIIKNFGYIQVILYGAIEASHFISSEIRYRRKSNVSTGGWVWGNFICPECNVPFTDPSCPHYPPTPRIRKPGINKEDFAPYFIDDGIHESVELSLVVAGNIRQAKIIEENLMNFV